MTPLARQSRGSPSRVVSSSWYQTAASRNFLIFRLGDVAKVVLRPSGTEPKAKFYFDVCDRIAEGESLDAAETRARDRMKQLQDAFVKLAGV